MNNYGVKININILTFKDGLKVLTESVNFSGDDLDECVRDYVDGININSYYIDQVKTYNIDGEIVINYVVVTNNYDNELLVSIEEVKNLKYIEDVLKYLGVHLEVISKYLFKDTFTIPELMSVYECIYNKKYDRRNFRKKLIKSNLIEEVGEFSKKTGRPAKVYKFKGGNNYE